MESQSCRRNNAQYFTFYVDASSVADLYLPLMNIFAHSIIKTGQKFRRCCLHACSCCQSGWTLSEGDNEKLLISHSKVNTLKEVWLGPWFSSQFWSNFPRRWHTREHRSSLLNFRYKPLISKYFTVAVLLVDKASLSKDYGKFELSTSDLEFHAFTFECTKLYFPHGCFVYCLFVFPSDGDRWILNNLNDSKLAISYNIY